jgi:hypothetical protein
VPPSESPDANEASEPATADTGVPLGVRGVDVPLDLQPDDVTERRRPKLASSRPPTKTESVAPRARSSDSDPTFIGTPFNSVMPGSRATPLRVALLAALAALCVIAILELWML